MENVLNKNYEIAEWMFNKLKNVGHLYQNEIVDDIFKKFGKEHIHENDTGNLAINKGVLSAFRKITEKDVVWERDEKMWRLRKSTDTIGKRLVD